jgi:hypothetical protein
VKPFPDDQGNEADRCENRQGQNEMRPKPVVFLAFVEHHLQCSYSERQERHANIIYLHCRTRQALNPRRIFVKAKDQEECQNSDRQIDEENPPPAVVVSDPASQGRADSRRDDRSDAVERKCQTALLRRKRVG